jgi:hypothetical protein
LVEVRMTPEHRRLNSFGGFSETMNTPKCGFNRRKHRDKLLLELYRAAELKCDMERRAEIERQSVSELRAQGKRFADASDLLRQALQPVRNARRDYTDELEECEELFAEDWGFTFAGIEENLKAGVDCLTAYECLAAARVHPKQRTAAEKRLVCKRMEAFGDIAEGAESHQDYPLGEKTPALDHWLIGEAASCLDRYRTPKKRQIQGYDTVIARLFYAAFGETRSEGSIGIELRRQKRDGRPEYSRTPHRILAKAFFPRTLRRRR